MKLSLNLFVLSLASVLSAASSAQAAFITFTGTGIGEEGDALAAIAKFEFEDHDFGGGNVAAVKITMGNVASTTRYRENLITGFFFSVNAVGNLPTTSAGFDGLAATVRDTNTTTISNVDIAPAIDGTGTDGTYQLRNGPFGLADNGMDFSAFSYGISTIGGGLGFNGSDVNAADYGIAAAGSDLTLDGLPSAIPVIDQIATFWIARPEEWTNLGQIQNDVRFTYGTGPSYFVTGTSSEIPPPVPEPGSILAMLSLVSFGAGAVVIRRRRAKKLAA